MSKTDDDKLLQLARTRFDRAVTAESDNRSRAIADLRFRYGEQWPDTIKQQRTEEKRPCLTLNKIPNFIRHVVNDIRQVRPALKIRPGDGAGNKETAEVIGGMIRAIEQSCNAEAAYDYAAEYAATIGWGFWKVVTDYEHENSFDQVIEIKRIKNPFSVYLDPDRKESDGSDGKFGFIVDKMDKTAFMEKYPNASAEWSEEGQGNHREKWYHDNAVQVAEYWVIEEQPFTLYMLNINGQQHIVDRLTDNLKPFKVKERESIRKTTTQYIITGTEVLERNRWAGKYIPIIECRGEELDIEGEMFLNGMVKDLRDPQRNYNYWRTMSTERVALAPKAPWVGARGAFKDPKWRNANRKNYAYLEYDIVENQPPPQRTPPPDVSPGIMQEITVSGEEFKSISGIHDPSLGERSNEVSGVALQKRQLRSDISNFHFVDNMARAIRHTGRVLADLIPNIYDTARLVTIIKQDGDEEEVEINRQFINKKTGKPQVFNLKQGRYATSVDIGPAYATLREEAVANMLELIKVNPAAAALISDLIAKNSDWPESDEAAKRLRMLLPANIEGEENPQVKAILSQAQQQVQQLKAVLQQVLQESQQKDLMLKNKNDEIAVKMQNLQLQARKLFEEIKLKYHEIDADVLMKFTELEVKENQNIPGSQV